MLPKKNNQASSEHATSDPSHPDLRDGRVVFFEEDGKGLLGLIQGTQKNRYQILPARGKEYLLPAQRLYPVSASSDAGSDGERRKYLEQLTS